MENSSKQITDEAVEVALEEKSGAEESLTEEDDGIYPEIKVREAKEKRVKELQSEYDLVMGRARSLETVFLV